MSMSTHIVAIVAPNEEFNKKLKAYKACEDAGVQPPNELLRFFRYEEPNPDGTIIDIELFSFVKQYNEEGRSGFDIDVSKIDKNIKTIRFYNSF